MNAYFDFDIQILPKECIKSDNLPIETSEKTYLLRCGDLANEPLHNVLHTSHDALYRPGRESV